MTKYLDDKGLKTFTTKMKGYADGKVGAVDKKVTSHISDTQNPHGVTKTQVGLDKVDNVKQIPFSEKGTADGVATLDADGKLTSTQIPATKTINGDSIFGTGNITVSTSLYKIVDALPTKNIDISKIYLVPATTTADKNNKTEYIYIGDPSKAYDATKWEKLGEEQKNATIETPGGSITVDTAFDTSSSNPIANKTVASKINTIESTLNTKVAQGDYDTAMGTVNSKLKALEDKTITTDSELSESSVHPIQTQAVYKAVQGLETKINGNSAGLTAAVGRISALETDGATGVKESGEGNGIASIKKVGKDIVATKGTFLTQHQSLTGYATQGWVREQKFAKTSDIPSLDGYVNDVQPDGTSGNGIANITKEGKIFKVTKSTFLTQNSLANYATQKWVGDQGFAKGTIPTKVSDLNNDSGFLTKQSLTGYVNSVEVPATDMMVQNGHAVAIMRKNGSKIEYTLKPFFNTLTVEDTAKKDGNGIAEVSIDPTKKYKLLAKKGKFITEATLGTSIEDYMKDKSYLKEEDMKETVVIKLVSDKSESDTGLIGATVTVKSGDTTVSTQTWQGSPISVKVPCGEEVTIEAQKKKGYKVSTIESFNPIPLNKRNIIITYKALSLGTFIIDTNDNLIDRNSWDENTQPAVGVALITEKVAIVIPTGTEYGRKWSTKSQLVEGIVTTTNKTEAGNDYKGKANTEAIVSALGTEAEAAYYCSNYTFKNGKKGYLMSSGEAVEIFYNITAITTLLNVIDSGQNNINSDLSVWTSTQYSATIAWTRKEMGLEAITKTYNNKTVVPIYSLYD